MVLTYMIFSGPPVCRRRCCSAARPTPSPSPPALRRRGRAPAPPAPPAGARAPPRPAPRGGRGGGAARPRAGPAAGGAPPPRHCRPLDVPVRDGDAEASWAQFLLGPESAFLAGAVVLACDDAGIRVLADHRPALLA